MKRKHDQFSSESQIPRKKTMLDANHRLPPSESDSDHDSSAQQTAAIAAQPSRPHTINSAEESLDQFRANNSLLVFHRRRKLAPPRPWPTIPTSVAATGPRSAHTEGKNLICVTRKTQLSVYLRRCKDIIMKDGYRSLHLSAMGAAIPHLAQLATSIPLLLPFPIEDIHTRVYTSTVDVQDEVVSQDEDKDTTYDTRCKSCLSIVIQIGNEQQSPKALENVGQDSAKQHQRGRRKRSYVRRPNEARHTVFSCQNESDGTYSMKLDAEYQSFTICASFWPTPTELACSCNCP